MQKLRDYINEHAVQCKARENSKTEDHSADLIFFEVTIKGDPDPDELKQLIVENPNGDFASIDLFDGSEHSYLELGAWIGDQGLALTLMGLGSLLGLWQLLTPKMIPGLDDDLIKSMAGSGLITICCNK